MGKSKKAKDIRNIVAKSKKSVIIGHTGGVAQW